VDDISITATATVTPTNPSGSGSASPDPVLPGATTLLTFNVTPGTNPTSTAHTVTADLSAIGIPGTQIFSGSGNTFTYSATVAPGTTPGVKTLPVIITENNPQSRTGSGTINLTVDAPPPPQDHIVISQVYGGGGNGGATYQNDFIELFNPDTVAHDLSGWTIQYASATGTDWQVQPLGGTMQPGEYYLIKLGTNDITVGAPVPPANINGAINMGGTAGKVALASAGDAFEGCPVGDPNLVDLVGYGTTANCREGATNAPAPSNTTAVFRKNGGFTDTNVNGADFATGTPDPKRRTTPIVELAPSVLSTDPRANGTNAPRDASITVNFTEPVTVEDGWFNISCVTTGAHNSATVAPGGANAWIIIPNVNFQAGEQCTVTVVREFVRDSDLDDSGPNTDLLTHNYSATFTVATGAAPAYPSEVHLTMGNPSGATADPVNAFNNYLMVKPEYTLSYNRDRGTPNWVSWHLADEWTGNLARVDTFRADPAVPADWYRVTHVDYQNSGFDRGHMTPNADRDPGTSIPINQATFLMSNMLPQAPDNNQGPWANLENFLRTLLPANEVYIIAGGAGTGGTGSNGLANTIANGHVSVPARTWKVALVIPKAAGDDVSRVTCATRVIAVNMPNVQGIRNDDWHNYLTTVDAIEQLTGYNFYSNLPDAVENCVEAGTNGANPPGTAGQSVTVAEDGAANIALEAVSSNPNASFTYTVSNPAHGTLTGVGATRTYTPAPDFNGTDSFTFSANDGSANSNTSTVTITVTEVNDAPVSTNDDKSTQEDTPLSFLAGGLLANDNAGAANEGGQTLSVTGVSEGADTHGTVSFADGQITYTPAANYHGAASFTYQVCDDGTTAGAPDARCTTATVNVAVESINDNPEALADEATTNEDTPVTVDVVANDSDVDGEAVSLESVAGAVHGTVSVVGGKAFFTPEANYNGAASFSYVVSDGHGGTATGSVSITVNPVNDAPTLSGVPASAATNELVAYTFTATAGDIDTPTQTLTFSLVGAPAGASINPATGAFSWTPTEAQGGTGVPFGFKVRVSDGVADADADISINVGEVNQNPTLDPIGSKSVNLGGTLSFTATGHDGDVPTQGLSYSLTGAPAGATIDAATGAFSWTPTAAQAGHVYTFGVRVTDNGSPALYAEEQISVGAAYTWSGVLPPVDANGGSVFNSGRTVPVRFRLTGASAGITNAVVRLRLFQSVGGVAGAELPVNSNSSAGNLFQFDGDQYHFNWDTSGLPAGSYLLMIDTGDGVLRVVNVAIR
jgi:endonuclease G